MLDHAKLPFCENVHNWVIYLSKKEKMINWSHQKQIRFKVSKEKYRREDERLENRYKIDFHFLSQSWRRIFFFFTAAIFFFFSTSRKIFFCWTIDLSGCNQNGNEPANFNFLFTLKRVNNALRRALIQSAWHRGVEGAFPQKKKNKIK